MDWSIFVSILGFAITVITTIITVTKSNQKVRSEIEMRVKSQQHQIEEMKDDIKTHNNYAVEIPVIKTELTYIKDMIGELKNEKISNK